MLKNHPKGLVTAFFTNLGERFGFYTMMAILVLFLQARYGLSEQNAGEIYSWFYFAVYASALFGGFVADYSGRYKQVVFWGQIIMIAGYVLMALPTLSMNVTMLALLAISLGNGMFKGNLQAVVGQLYDDEKYAKYRDSAYMFFYMGINIGAFFAPFFAVKIRDWWLLSNGFLYDGSLPALSHQLLDGKLQNLGAFREMAERVTLGDGGGPDLNLFAENYLGVFSKAYNAVFALAAGSMIVSLLIYLIFNKTLPPVGRNEQQLTERKRLFDLRAGKNKVILLQALLAWIGTTVLIALIPGSDFKLGLAVGLFVAYTVLIFRLADKGEYPRIVSLVLVFVVIILFWMSFHQNGLTLTFFARDYTVKQLGPVAALFFNLESLLSLVLVFAGLVLLLHSKSTFSYRLIGLSLVAVFGYAIYYFISRGDLTRVTSPELFQSFNPLYIVILAPISMYLFSYLASKGKEPSTPRKIGIGMIFATLGFTILLVASLKLVSPYLLGGSSLPDEARVSPYWLMSSYLILSIAELFLSPMGISFVSKVAPPRFRSLMQSGWLMAVALGNKLVFVGSALWGRIELYNLWGIFVISSIVSALLIFMLMRRIERSV